MRRFDGFVATETRLFYEAWLQWRGIGLVPRRADIDLASIRDHLPQVALLEHDATEDYRVRLAGTAMRNFFGFDPTGRTYRELTAPDEWPTRRSRMNGMIATPCGCHASYTRHFDRIGEVTLEAIFLPLLDDANAVRFLLTYQHVAPKAPGRRPDQSVFLAVAQVRLADYFRFIDIGAGVPVAGFVTPVGR